MESITQSMEDYLEAIYEAIVAGRPALVKDIARHLSVKMPSVVKAIRELKRQGFVTQEPYAPIELTVKGRRVAVRVSERHALLRSFLVKIGVSRATADRDACRMEHILSAETLSRIRDTMETGANRK